MVSFLLNGLHLSSSSLNLLKIVNVMESFTNNCLIPLKKNHFFPVDFPGFIHRIIEYTSTPIAYLLISTAFCSGKEAGFKVLM